MKMDGGLIDDGAFDERVSSYVIAYDAACRRRRARARRLIEPWRGGGQRSVHEVRLGGAALVALIRALMDCLDTGEDRLLLLRYPVGSAWADAAAGRAGSGLMGRFRAHPPRLLPGLIAYDIRDPRRLRAVHRLIESQAYGLQQSLYWFSGPADSLRALVRALVRWMRAEDDLRVYPVMRRSELVRICGPSSPLAGMEVTWNERRDAQG